MRGQAHRHQSILIIGAGPIIIGQACEFDYSGAQACKALREEGYRVILVNSNPATIMTDPEMADAIYIEPINWRTLARIIEKERPDALLPTMGGQTALNTALDLVREGVLEKYEVELIAASRAAIDMAEDRELFRNAMREIGLETPHSPRETACGPPPCRSRRRWRRSSSTPYFSSTPFANESAQLSAVCPPMVGSSASGRSFSMILRHDLRRDRLDIGRVRHVRIGHDGRRIGIDQDDPVALLPGAPCRPACPNSRIRRPGR